MLGNGAVFFKDDYEKEALFVDWLGEDNFEYLNLADRKQYSEIFSNRYENRTLVIHINAVSCGNMYRAACE